MVSITNCIWSGLGHLQGFTIFTALFLTSIILVTLAFCVRQLKHFLLPALPSLWMFFVKYLYLSPLSVTVPGEFRSQGCHGYLLGLLAPSLSLTRHLFHTHILSMGFFLFLFYLTTLSCYNNNKEKITKIYKYDHLLNNWAIDVTFPFFNVILIILQLPNYWVAIKL